MNALPVSFAQPAVPPSPAPAGSGDGAPGGRPFEDMLAAASRPPESTRTDTPAQAEATDAEAPSGQDGADPTVAPDQPWLSQWASYLAPPAATSVDTAPAPDGAADAGAALAPAAAPASATPADALVLPPTVAEQDAVALATPPAAGVTARPTATTPASGTAPDSAGRRTDRTAPTARTQPPAASQPAAGEPAPHEASAGPAGVLQASATVPVNAPPSHHAPAPPVRGEAPTVPGAPVPLHAGALQDRIDTALRWMAGGNLQTAQLRVDPEALGPITIHLRLDGDAASVVFGSNHESTRQALENTLAGLKDALAANGLSLGQASVGSEQQSGFLAARQFAGREAPADRAPPTGTDASSPVAGGAVRATSSGNGMVDLYA
ncbi:flagellar hook-length control protein FliK [Pigmentiphaga sp. H8]|uniref:flagellar hook-length control protein FliK n=1 Tax=Pigmentiphaga sp. H8 TaxID=2488560 RepID=UPI000F59EA30|nr:flagellar hook-length control protein FliK [Pigmentiphaga sp. H8]AZG09576.1 flagellar hook-length control protein FliK [Pigmentiphaga sp. H8]